MLSRKFFGLFPCLLLCLIVPCAALRGELPPEKKSAVAPSARYEKDIQAFEAADRKSPPPQGAVLFTGASSIRMWKTLNTDFPEVKVINRGFGGSQMADSVYFVDRISIPYKPKIIVINAGGNDINAGKSPEQVLADFQAYVEIVHAKLPDTKIIFFSLTPAPIRWAQAEKQQKANALVKAYIDSNAAKNLDFILLWDQFLGADGKPREDLFLKDRLHSNAEGYKIRAEAVRPHLK